MEDFLRNEVAIANMPRIRVQPRSSKKGSIDDIMSGYGMSGSNRNSVGGRNFTNFLGASSKYYDIGNAVDHKKQDKPRLNYEVLIAKAQKKVNGSEKEKVVKPMDFEPARPDHVYVGD